MATYVFDLAAAESPRGSEEYYRPASKIVPCEASGLGNTLQSNVQGCRADTPGCPHFTPPSGLGSHLK